MSLFSIDTVCPNCDWRDEALVQRPAPAFGEKVELECTNCGTQLIRALNAVMPLRASHPDGYSKGPGYQAVKEAAKLRAARANMPSSESARSDINKEIRQVEKAAGRGYVKKEKGQK